jgi:hypothetical protein
MESKVAEITRDWSSPSPVPGDAARTTLLGRRRLL